MMKDKKTAKLVISLAMSMLMLAGCQSTSTRATRGQQKQVAGMLAGGAAGGLLAATAVSGPAGVPVGIAVGQLYGGMVGHQLAQAATPEEALAKEGVDVIRVGDRLTLVLPAQVFFYQASPVMQSGYYPVLDMIARYLEQQTKTSITVTAYSSDTNEEGRNLALSKARAQAVADYLWRQSIDARMIVARGKGSGKSIAALPRGGGRDPNNRVEISMQIFPQAAG